MAEARRLDPTQHAAAAADAPVQLTLAGPGAGKTTTLAVRFVHLVRQGVDPRRILAVTFTRKAAIEMQDRIVRLLRLDGPKGLAVDTFHAFAFRHLRRQPQRFGLPEQFDLWDVPQQRHVFHARRMWWNEEIDIIDLIGGMKERLIDAAGFARMVGDKSDELRAYYPAAVEFFNVYEAALCDAGAIDFADMVPLVTRAMAHDTACRSAITGAFDHMLVDEYQDVNPGQLDLIAHFVVFGAWLQLIGNPRSRISKNRDVPTTAASPGIFSSLLSPIPLIVISKLGCEGVSSLTSVPRANANAFAIRLEASAILLAYAPGSSFSCVCT